MLRTKLRWLLPIVILCLVSFAWTTAHAQEEVDEETAIRTIILADAFGNSFAGDAFDYNGANVQFAKKVKPSNFLIPNDAHLVRTSVLTDDGKQSSGTLQYADPYGRLATYLYTLDYSVQGENSYKIRKTSIKSYEPRNPKPECYFIPADAISLETMQKKETGELLAFARENADVLTPGETGEVKKYHVVAFCMHRLRDNATWMVTQEGRKGTSWSKGDWHVSSIDAVFGLNDQTAQIFRLLYSPGKKSPLTNNLYQLGSVTNQSLTSWNGPVDEVNASPSAKQLIEAYSLKQQPKILQ